MKNTVLKKLILSFVVVIVVCAAMFSLAACNKKKTVTIGDVFLNETSPAEFTSYKTEFVLPTGWTVYTSSTTKSTESSNVNSDVGYIKEIDAFVVECNGVLSVVKCGDERVYFEGGQKGILFPLSIGIAALRVKNGIIVCKFANGEAGAFDQYGRTLISRTKIANGGSLNIDKIIKVLDADLIAVSAGCDKEGKSGYTSIYRPTLTGELKDRGELVCRIKNSGDLTYVNGFDGAYVSVVGNSDGSYMFKIPAHAGAEIANLDSGNGYIATEDADDYFQEITYIGGGRFLVHEDWTVESTADYSYYDGNDYYVFRRKIYDANKDALSDYTGNSDKVFLNLTNKYYDSKKGGIDVKSYLKDGYMYASYGLNIVNKVGLYDQYILDGDLNVVMSLTGNFGITLDVNGKEEISVFDLVMTAMDGNYYVPYLPSKIAVYDENGAKVGENTDYSIKSQNIANGAIIACIKDPDGSDDDFYTIFDLKGNELTEEYTLVSGAVKHRKYSQLAAFRGYYTIARRPNKDGVATYYLIGRDGVEVETMSDGTKPLADMNIVSASARFKIGCYMTKVDSGEKKSDGKTKYLFGIKNFNANADKNVVMPATMEDCILYASNSSPTDVFVFEKITGEDGSTFTYVVHRLI